MATMASQTLNFIVKEFQGINLSEAIDFADGFIKWEEENMPKWPHTNEPWWGYYMKDIIRYPMADEKKLIDIYETHRENALYRYVDEGLLPVLYTVYVEEWFSPEGVNYDCNDCGIEFFYRETDLIEDFNNAYNTNFATFSECDKYAKERLLKEKNKICNLYEVKNKNQLEEFFSQMC